MSTNTYILRNSIDKYEMNTTSTENTDISYPIDNAYENFKWKYYDVFLNVINQEELEDGYLSKSEVLYKEITKEYGYVFASNFINDIYKYGIQENNLKVLLSILKIISNVTNENEINIFCVIAISLLNYKNVEIVDSAIACFEKWGRKNDAEILKNFKEPTESWLAEYYKNTISYLEGLE